MSIARKVRGVVGHRQFISCWELHPFAGLPRVPKGPSLNINLRISLAKTTKKAMFQSWDKLSRGHTDVSEYGNIDQTTTASNASVNGRRREICLTEVTLHSRGDFS